MMIASLLLQAETVVGYSLLEKLSNPILAILLFVLATAIIILYRSYSAKDKSLSDLQAVKEKEVKELYNIIISLKDSDKEMLTELKTTLQTHMNSERTMSEEVRKLGDLVMQLITKK